MQLLPGWDKRGEQAEQTAHGAPAAHLPLRPDHFTAGTTFVTTAEQAAEMAELAHQRPIAWVGLDTEFQYSRPGVPVGRQQTVVHDPHSVRPLLLSLALAEPDEGRSVTLYPFVVDVRDAAVLDGVQMALALPCPYIGHFLQAELLCLWRLGLEEPRVLWDTLIAEKALGLGRNHQGYKVRPEADEAGQIRAAEAAEEDEERRLGLVTTCRRYGVVHPFARHKERLQKSFLEHPQGAPFTAEQIDYAAADAVAAAGLYPSQLQAAGCSGLVRHLETVEMPWVAVNARMHWRGVRPDRALAEAVTLACRRHIDRFLPELAAEGLTNVRSPKQLGAYFRRKGLLELFRRGAGYTFDKKQLELVAGRDPAIARVRAVRRALDLLNEPLLSPALVGADRRVHPQHRQLGAHTGRQSCSAPNVLGLGKVFRPLIVPEPGRGIGEVDLSQIEIGITAAVYRDPDLAAMFNGGDAYAAMAQRFYGPRLGPGDQTLTPAEFKRKHRDLRDRMKPLTLGIIYGLTPHGLSLGLGITPAAAASLLDDFLGMFPALQQAREDVIRYGSLRGFVTTATGLRRYRSTTGLPTSWERNWMTNLPVQGTAAALFKLAGIRLDRLYRRYDAWLLVPLHDAFVFEAPVEHLEAVTELTARVMCEAVEEHFPELRPRAETNIEHPRCWNKEGHVDSIERWMENPLYSL